MKLIIRCHGETTEYTPDPNLGIIKVGRADTNDIKIKGEKAASREHLTLERTVDGWKLVDQMSSNGTALNGEKVNFGFIKEGDLIQVGQTTIQVTGLEPAPGASPAPARPARRAAARAVPARAKADEEAGSPEGRPAPPIPAKKSPVGGLVALGVIVLVVGIGGYVLFDQLGGGTPTQPRQDDVAKDDAPRQAELSDDEKAALTLADSVVSSDDSTIDKINRLEKIHDGLKGTRGSKAASDISLMKSKLMQQLDDEVARHVETELEAIEGGIVTGMYADSISRLVELEGYLQSDAYIANFANAHRKKLAESKESATAQNQAFIDSSYETMRHYAAQMRYDDALEVCDDLLARAWMDQAARDLYETEREKIVALKEQHEIKKAAVEEKDDEPADADGILGKVKESDGKLPGKNPLLPNGKRSEREFVSALHAKMVKAADEGTLTENIFTYRGKTAKIARADESKLVLEVVHVDKRTQEELIYNTSVKWDDMNAEDVLQLYDRLPELADEDVLALVVFCYDNGFTDMAAERAWQLYERRNDWKEGIDTLIAAKRKIMIPDGGFVEFNGALVTPDEKENAIFYSRLESVLERFEKGVGHKDRRRREDSEEAFSELLEMGERAVKPAIEILQGVLDDEVENAKRATGLLAADKERMNSLLAELDRRREYALELIMDAERYPYPYGPNQAEVQADVNERVAAVREIWNDPAKFTGQTNPQFDAIMDKIRAIAQRMAQIDPSQKYYKETPEETVKYIENIANDELSIKNYAGGNSAKEKLHNYNVEVMEYNENFPTGEGHTNADGRLQVKITNEYRIMFARPALKLNDKLFWGAWHHSKYCVEHNGGQIAHNIPGEPRGETPADRMRYEGYPGGGGENIHMNGAGPTAQSSHDAWCNSSGHHRNILNPNWRVLGSGKFQTIWTQKFGSVDEGDQNSESRGGE